jgi:L,D-transpeptidase YcbB
MYTEYGLGMSIFTLPSALKPPESCRMVKLGERSDDQSIDCALISSSRAPSALNVPVAARIKQLEASLERLLGMDFVFAERYVVVNIPAAFVEAVAHDKVERRYRVIVGKVDKPSPTLTAYITAVNLNPTWTVPLSITKNEIIRHMRRDPSYL